MGLAWMKTLSPSVGVFTVFTTLSITDLPFSLPQFLLKKYVEKIRVFLHTLSKQRRIRTCDWNTLTRDSTIFLSCYSVLEVPIFQYSKTARNLYRQSHRTLTPPQCGIFDWSQGPGFPCWTDLGGPKGDSWCNLVVLIAGAARNGTVAVTDVRVKTDASLKTEELVKIAESSTVLISQKPKDRRVKELLKTQFVSGVSPSSAKCRFSFWNALCQKKSVGTSKTSPQSIMLPTQV